MCERVCGDEHCHVGCVKVCGDGDCYVGCVKVCGDGHCYVGCVNESVVMDTRQQETLTERCYGWYVKESGEGHPSARDNESFSSR